MRIFDELGNQLDSYDPAKGKVRPDRLFICHHKAVQAVTEQGHYETVAQYPNGGKDLKWVVDVPAVKSEDAWDEYEDILRFVPFTEAEAATNRIADLKKMLADTDYNILKIVEGAATLAEMASIIAKRALWRKEINELEERIVKEG